MIKKDTLDYRLVSLIGLAGEIKMSELYKLNYGKEYIRKTISRLNSNGFTKVYTDFNNINPILSHLLFAQAGSILV